MGKSDFTYEYVVLVAGEELMLQITKLEQSAPFLLPPGNSSNNSILRLQISVCDSLDCQPFIMWLKVMIPTEKQLLAVLNTFLGKTGILVNNLKNHAHSTAVSSIQAYSTLLHVLTNDTDKRYTHKILLEGLASATGHLYTAGDIMQYGQTLRALTKNTSMLVLDLQDVAAEALKAVTDMFATCRMVTPSKAFKISQALLDVAANILEASTTTYDAVQYKTNGSFDQEIKRSRSLFYNVYETIKSSLTVVNNKEVPGGKPALFDTPDISFVAIVLSAKKNGSIDFPITSYANASIVPNLTASRVVPKALPLQVTTFRKSPFFWNRTTFVNSSVVGFQIRNTTKTLGLNSVKVSIDQAALGQNILNLTHVCNDSTSTSFLRFSLVSPGEMVFIRIFLSENVSTAVHVYIKLGAVPQMDPVSNDFYFIINASSTSNSSSGAETTNSSGHSFVMQGSDTRVGIYYMILKYADGDCQEVTKVSILSLTCKLWNRTTDGWNAGSLQVHPESTLSRCLCSAQGRVPGFPPTMLGPLFIGAAIFVPPNAIDFSSVFTKLDLKNNGAVFATVVTVLLIYLILMFMLLPYDRRDWKMWKLLPLKDNPEESLYHYLITVKTGMLTDAGTKANIFFIIHFEDSDTGIRHLENSECKEFIQGGVRCFVLSTTRYYGRPIQLRIWLDTSGDDIGNKSWFLSEVVLCDTRTDEQFYFVCNNWLAVDQGDGRVCRDITVSDHQAVFDSKRLLASTVKSNYAEGHMWSSIFFRPSKSNFSRLERLSSCVSLLFLMMIVNGMWFETDTGGASAPHIGPFTYGELFVMIVSALMEVPISILIVQIFRRTGHKPWKKAEGGGGGCTSQQFPHWTLYIAWTLVVLVIGTSGFFTILYSMEWGPEKANRWLVRFLTSFCMSVILIQPIKILSLSVVGMVMAKRKRNMDDQHTRLYRTDEKCPKQASEEKRESEDSYVELPELDYVEPPPQVESLAMLAETLRQEREASAILSSAALHASFTLALLLIVYTRVDGHAFHMHRQMKRIFTENSFDRVRDQQAFWKWMNTTALHNLYPEVKSKSARDAGIAFLPALGSYRVGPVRLWQFRKVNEKDSCQFMDSAGNCFRPNLRLYQDSGSYSKGWQELNSNASYIHQPEDSFWIIQQVQWKNAPNKIGELHTFFGGGYVADLGVMVNEASGNANYLEQNSWLDACTMGIFVQFTVYNANVNLFCFMEVLLESLSMDMFQASSNVKVFQLFENKTSLVILKIVAYTLYLITTLYCVVRVISGMAKEKVAYLKDTANLAETANIVLRIGAVVLFYHQNGVASVTLAALTNNPAAFVDLSGPASLDEMSTQFLGFLTFVALLQIIPLLRFNSTMNTAVNSVARCTCKLRGVAFVFLVSLIGYGLVFWKVLDGTAGAHRSFGRSIGLLLATMFRAPVFGKLYAGGGATAVILHLTFMVMFVVLLLNALMVVVGEAFHHRTKENSALGNQVSVVFWKGLNPIITFSKRMLSKLNAFGWKHKKQI
ncbi:unnamed protein product [Lampetra planeri]